MRSPAIVCGLAMIVAHVAVDAWALVVAPLFSRWWLEPPFS